MMDVSYTHCCQKDEINWNWMFCSEPCHTTVDWYPVLNRQNRKLLSESIFLVEIVFSTSNTKKKKKKDDDPEDSMQQWKWLTDIHSHSKKHCGNEDRARYGISMTWWELIIYCWQHSAPVLWQQFCFNDQQITAALIKLSHSHTNIKKASNCSFMYNMYNIPNPYTFQQGFAIFRGWTIKW